MPEIDVINYLSDISFSGEQRENVAKVLDALVADEVAREIKARVSPERPADYTVREPAPADEPKRRKKSPTS